jgi:predicted acetyltransferase
MTSGPAEAPERDGWKVRPLTEGDRSDLLAVDSHAFGMTAPEELVEAERDTHEDDRDIGAFDGDTLAGIAAAYSFEIGVPGATVPAAGVTWVAVLPTHRRRGVLRALMTHQLRSIHEAGREPVAILWASEPQIYGRFGYGAASASLSLVVPRGPRTLRADVPTDPGLRLRLVDPDDWPPLAGVYDAVSARRPGVPVRDDRWWRRAVRDLPSMRDGASALRCVLAETADGPRGYALYRTAHTEDDFGAGDVKVREVMAADGPALAALYRFLFDLDLMARTHLWTVPVDDPLQHWLQNPRLAKPRLGDGLYARLVDLPAALSARRYAHPLDLVLEVRDDLCAWNAGRWRLTGGTDAARCERTDDAADLALDVAELGAAYLGGQRLSDLGEAGRVTEHRPGALAAATSAFSHSPAPWCPAIF